MRIRSQFGSKVKETRKRYQLGPGITINEPQQKKEEKHFYSKLTFFPVALLVSWDITSPASTTSLFVLGYGSCRPPIKYLFEQSLFPVIHGRYDKVCNKQ